MCLLDPATVAAGVVDAVAAVPPLRGLRAEIDDRLRRIPTKLNDYGYDPWGFHPRAAARAALLTAILYRYWFRVETRGIEQLPRGRMLVIGNHAGQVAIDAAMVASALLLEADPPRVVRGMGEYWLSTVPFLNVVMARTGSVVGTPQNCVQLLEAGEAVIAFPEGVRGVSKLYKERYRLKEFGLGFMRLALATGSPIVPVAVIGSEEQAPAVANLRWLARLLRMPAFPLTLTWPHLGPLGLIPFPVKYRIYFGGPMHFTGDHNEEDEVIRRKVDQVKQRIQGMIAEGLAERRRRGPILGIFI